eukprot:3525186-Rhodomonas_salina.1
MSTFATRDKGRVSALNTDRRAECQSASESHIDTPTRPPFRILNSVSDALAGLTSLFRRCTLSHPANCWSGSPALGAGLASVSIMKCTQMELCAGTSSGCFLHVEHVFSEPRRDARKTGGVVTVCHHFKRATVTPSQTADTAVYVTVTVVEEAWNRQPSSLDSGVIRGRAQAGYCQTRPVP